MVLKPLPISGTPGALNQHQQVCFLLRWAFIPNMKVPRNIAILTGCLVIILVCIMVILVFAPFTRTTPSPAGTVIPAGSTNLSRACSDPSPDSPFNLQQENREYIAVPTVVDINEENGNLLVRGPIPLILRNGPGNCPATSPYLNQSDWRFAYDELNGFMRNASGPAYFSDSERNHISGVLRTFDLADYQVIDVSLLWSGEEQSYLDAEERAFGGNFSTCTGPLNPGTIHGQNGNMIWSPLGTANTCVNISCANPVLYTNTSYNNTGPSCSMINLIRQIDTLMKEKDPSGKKRLIYYHCTLGRDRTGAVTISYLLQRHPEMSYCQALQYAEDLGRTSPPPQYFNGGTIPLPEAQTLALAYCTAINGRNCSACTS
jgi:hypothetical protein